MILKSLIPFIIFLFPSIGLSFSEEKFAMALGLELVSEGNPYNFLGVNRLYTNDDMSRKLLIMDDVPEQLSEIRILKAKGGYFILEVPKSKKSYTSMALVGFTEDEIRQYIKTTSVWRKIWQELNPLPRAYGVECPALGTQTETGLESVQDYFGSTFSKGILKCLSSTLQGVWDSTGGSVVAMSEGIANLIRDPEGFWNKKVKEVENLKSFILNFETKLKEMAVGIANLPSEVKAQMLCGFVGGLGADIVIGILTGGAGFGKIVPRLESYLSKIVRLEKVFQVLNEVEKAGNIPIRFWEKLATSNLPDSVIDNLNAFAKYDLPDFIQGTMQCAL